MRRITNSERGTFMSCPRLWMLKYAFKIEHLRSESPKMLLGTMCHAGLDALWASVTTGPLGPDGYTLLGERKLLIAPGMFDYGDTLSMFKHRAVQKGMLESDFDALVVQAKQVLFAYEDHWSRYGTIFMLGATSYFPEAELKSSLGTKGTMDKAVTVANDMVVYRDHKFTSASLDGWLKDFNPRQSLVYSVIGRELHGDKFAGFELDLAHTGLSQASVLFTPTGKSRKYSAKLPKVTNTTWEASGHVDASGVLGDKLKKRDASGMFFRRKMIVYTDDQLDEWIREEETVGRNITSALASIKGATDAVGSQDQMMKISVALKRMGHICPRNFHHCKSFGRRCELEDVCSTRMLQDNLLVHTDVEKGRYGADNQVTETNQSAPSSGCDVHVDIVDPDNPF